MCFRTEGSGAVADAANALRKACETVNRRRFWCELNEAFPPPPELPPDLAALMDELSQRDDRHA